jgi:uncharacterized membrane protein
MADMQGPAKLLGHSIHPMLVALPMGLLPSAIICDILNMAIRNSVFGIVAFWMLTFGILGAIVAAVPGLVDWTAIPSGTRASRLGLYHLFVNVAGLGLFVASWCVRVFARLPNAHWEPFVLALAGLALIFIGGWLGGELVEQHGMGVRRESALDAPSSWSVDHPSQRKPVRRPTEPHPV